MDISSSKVLVTQKDYGRFSGFCYGNLCRFIGGVGLVKKEMRGSESKRLLIKCHSEENAKGESNNFVKLMRESQPYFEAHRGSTFVVNFSTEIVDTLFFDSLLEGGFHNPGSMYFHRTLRGNVEDILLVHGLGIKFVLVPGTQVQIDKLLGGRGIKPNYQGRYRITDTNSLNAAMDAAGGICIRMEAKLSPVPIASGNFLAAKKRGVVDGIDYEETGEVKKIDVDRIREGLDQDCIVILSNLGYSSSGDVLNCNSCEVATTCALALEAEKLICIIDGPILDENERLIPYLTLQDADMLIHERAKESEITVNDSATYNNLIGFNNGNGLGSGEYGFAIGGQEKVSRSNGYLSELAATAFVCRGGVQRVHVLDGTIGGVLLLEMFQRDGTMVARDLYEGTRMARETDIPEIKQLIQPFEESSALAGRTQEEFVKCGFSACSMEHIPEKKLKNINLSHGSKHYMKKLQLNKVA